MTPKKEIIKEEETFARFDFRLIRISVPYTHTFKRERQTASQEKILINRPKG